MILCIGIKKFILGLNKENKVSSFKRQMSRFLSEKGEMGLDNNKIKLLNAFKGQR